MSNRWRLMLLLVLILGSFRLVTTWRTPQCHQQSNCLQEEKCFCPMNAPNWPKVDQNPQLVLIAIEVKNLTQELYDNITLLVNSIPKPSDVHCLVPTVTLLLSIPVENYDLVREASEKYQIGCYISRQILESRSLDTLVSLVKNATSSLNLIIDNTKKNVNVCRSEVFSGPDYDNYLAALNTVNITADWSYRTEQPMYPYTMDYPGVLCDEAAVKTNNISYLCPGVLSGQQIIPNSAIITPNGTSCFTLNECYELVGKRWTALNSLVLDNFYHRLLVRKTYHDFLEAKQPFPVNLDESLVSVKEVRLLLQSIATWNSRSHKRVSYASKETYFFNVSNTLLWMSRPITAQTLETEVEGYRVFRCPHKTEISEGFLNLLAAALVIHGFIVVVMYIAWIYFAFLSICPLTDGQDFPVVSGVLLSWVGSFIIGIICIPLELGCCQSINKSKKTTVIILLAATAIALYILSVSAYLLHYIDNSSEKNERSGYVKGVLVLLMLSGAVFCILLGLSECFSRNDMAELDHETVGSQELPRSRAVAVVTSICQATLSILFLGTVIQASDEVSFIRHKSWFNYQSILFISIYHMFLQVIALQSVLYTKHCESWLYIYELKNNQQHWPDNKRYRKTMAVFIILLFLIMPVMSTLFQHAMFDNWSDFNTLPKALYFTTFVVTFMYGLIPLIASSAIKKSKIPNNRMPFGVSKTWAAVLAILQTPLTFILSQIINAADMT